MPPDYCKDHIEFATHLAEIKTSVANIEKGIAAAATYKTGVYSALISVAVVLVVQVVGFSYLYGKLANQVDVNTGRLTRLESNVK